MENNTGSLSEKQAALKARLAQENKRDKAVIGSGYFYDALYDALEAGIVSSADGTALSTDDYDTARQDGRLEHLVFRFEDGTAYRLAFLAGTDRGTELWLDVNHPLTEADLDKMRQNQEKMDEIERTWDQTTLMNKLIRTENYFENDDTIDEIEDAVKQLIDKGMVYTENSRERWVPLQDSSEFDLQAEQKLLIRETPTSTPYIMENDKDGRPEHLSAQPASEDQLVSFIQNIPVPAKPDKWGPFQFLRAAANGISKAFGGSGLKEYRDYDQKKKEYEITKYYTLTAAGYRRSKPDAVKEYERERAVELYLRINYDSMVVQNKKNLDFIGETNPLDNDQAREAIRKGMLASPKLEAFVKDPAVQDCIKGFWGEGFRIFGSDGRHGCGITGLERRKFTEAGGELSGGAVFEYLQKVKSDRSEQRREARKKTEQAIENQSDRLARQVGLMMDLGNNDTEKTGVFTESLKEAMNKNTPEAWGIRHFVQDCLHHNGSELLIALQEEFGSADKKAELETTMKNIVNPQNDEYATMRKYGKTVQGDLQEKLAEVQNGVHTRTAKPEKTAAVSVGENNAAVKQNEGPAAQ